MTKSKNERPDYALGYGKASVAWMAARDADRQGAFFASHLSPGMTLLDCGCGPGTMTCGLAAAVAPGKVNAIDIEPSQVAQAESLAKEKGLTNIEFQQADITSLPFADNSFDAVFVSAVLGNIANPADGIAEVLRVLKPRGIAGFREFDHGGNIVFPQNALISRSVNLYLAMRRQSGHAENFGRELKGAMRRAGFQEIDSQAVFETSSDDAAVAAYADAVTGIFAEMFADKAVKLGMIDNATYQDFVSAWQEWARDPGAFFAAAWVEAIGRKKPL